MQSPSPPGGPLTHPYLLHTVIIPSLLVTRHSLRFDQTATGVSYLVSLVPLRHFNLSPARVRVLGTWHVVYGVRGTES